MTTTNIAAPLAKRDPKILVTHGDQRIDDYFWLNDRENPEVIAYLDAENTYTKAVMADTQAFQDNLYTEMVARFKQDDQSVPYFENGYWYQTASKKALNTLFIPAKKAAWMPPRKSSSTCPKWHKDTTTFPLAAKM